MYKAPLFAMGLLGSVLIDIPPAVAAPPPSQDRRCTSGQVEFGTLTDTERRRFQSRYRTRVRMHGQDTAERFLYEEICLSLEEQRALRPPSKNRGKNCRGVSTPVTSMDGSMTIGIRQVCD